MAEMNAVSRFFINFSAGRRAARLYRWIQQDAPLPPSAHCLEVGCGNATLAARLVDGMRPAEYVATDLDPAQLEAASRNLARRYPRGIPPALVIREADMLHLPFPDASFDVVLAFVALHHASPTHGDFTRIPDALTEMTRVLRPDGMLVYQEFLHKEAIRDWLSAHGYAIDRQRKRWRLESVVARRRGASGPAPAASPDVPPA